MEKMLRNVLFTLDQIPVRGRENMDRMLGCMRAVEKVADAMKHNREALAKVQPEAPAKAEPIPERGEP